jgi:hypothetical protein
LHQQSSDKNARKLDQEYYNIARIRREPGTGLRRQNRNDKIGSMQLESAAATRRTISALGINLPGNLVTYASGDASFTVLPYGQLVSGSVF